MDTESPKTKPQRGNPSWKKGGASPNPTGRPRGIVDKRFKVTKALAGDAEKVARVVLDAALAGDVQAAALVLSRVAPALKSQMEKVNFTFDPAAPMTEQVEQVLLAISRGEVSPDTGKQIIESIAALAGIKHIDEIDQRLATLEGQR